MVNPVLGTAVTYETLTWIPRGAAGSAADMRAMRRESGEYRAAVPAEIAELSIDLPAHVLAVADEASHEIARFDAELGGEIAPFGAVLLRTESAASSNIENLTASARAIAEAELPGNVSKHNAALIVANTQAMNAAVALADSIDADAILTMHHALMHASAPTIAGKWRTESVWIGGGNFGPRGALFVPPRHERVPAAIDDLIRFANRGDVAVLPQIAVSHAQFETIHPFPDGNGRAGRALAHAMLRSKKLTRHVTVPISAGLLANTTVYFDALTAYRDGQVAPIVQRFAEASMLAIANGRQLVDDLREIRAHWAEQISARRDSAIHRVADLLLKRPVVNAILLRKELGIETKHARRHLEPLVAAGIIVEFTDRKRNRAWRAPTVLQALDAFAERAGRRGL